MLDRVAHLALVSSAVSDSVDRERSCPPWQDPPVGIPSSSSCPARGSCTSLGGCPSSDSLLSPPAGPVCRQLARPARAGGVHGVPPALRLLPDERRRAEHCTLTGTPSLAQSSLLGAASGLQPHPAGVSPRRICCTYLRHLHTPRAVPSGEGAGGSQRLWELSGTIFCLGARLALAVCAPSLLLPASQSVSALLSEGSPHHGTCSQHPWTSSAFRI